MGKLASALKGTVFAAPPVAPSPESAEPTPREKLAEAIEVAAQRRDRLEQTRKAVALAEGIVATARERVDRANAALREAQGAQVTRIADAARAGTTPEPGTALRDARREDVEASDELEAARQALETVRAPLPDYERAAEHADDLLKRAAGEVLALALPDLMATTRAKLDEIIPFAWMLNFVTIRDSGAHFSEERRPQRQEAERLQEAIFSLGPRSTGAAPAKQDAMLQPWRDAFSALISDPSAPLPRLP